MFSPFNTTQGPRIKKSKLDIFIGIFFTRHHIKYMIDKIYVVNEWLHFQGKKVPHLPANTGMKNNRQEITYVPQIWLFRKKITHQLRI